MEELHIISNEKIFEKNGNFFCDNIDIKSTPEGLNEFFKVSLFGKISKIKRAHKINLKNINIFHNIFSYLLSIFNSLHKGHKKYLIISISPYTFFIIILLRIFNKKPMVYLRSDGYGEYKSIVGPLGPLIYHFMFFVTSKCSFLISCRKYILKGKFGKIVNPSQLNPNWLVKHSQPNLNKIKLLYVGRIRKEKGIFSLLELLKKIKIDLSLTIVGAEKEKKLLDLKKNITTYEIEANEKKLIKFYDDHNIFILPSYTEGHPMVLLEALSRRRPVIIFRDIEHVIGNKKGIFVAERNSKSLVNTISFIKRNYYSIQKQIEKNVLPTKKDFINKLREIISDY